MKIRPSAFLTCPLLWLSAGLARADLPRMEDPSRGKGRGTIETIRNYGYDVVILLALGICAVAFLVVATAGQEGVIQTDRQQRLSYPPDGKLRIQSAGGMIYLHARAVLPPTRIQLRNINNRELIYFYGFSTRRVISVLGSHLHQG